MPLPRSWLPQLPAIRQAVQAASGGEFDRDAVAQLFSLRRRAALALMKEIGPERLRTGRWVLPREKLLGWIEAQEPEAAAELSRKERFTEALFTADASLPRRPSILLAPRRVSPEQREVYAAGLPPGVTLEPGSPNRLLVVFSTMEELAERLLGTGLALNNRFDHYQALLEPKDRESAAEDEAERADAEYVRDWQAKTITTKISD